MPQDEKNLGEQLNQLSRLLFDEASNYWYLATILNIILGIVTTVVSLVVHDLQFQFAFAVVAAIILGICYYFRLHAESRYDAAETMRRQSVITEALAWPISQTQFSLWREKAGSRILALFRLRTRDADYYTTEANSKPQKLLEMTLESAFYTRHLYEALVRWLEVLTLLFVIMLIGILTSTPFSTDGELRLKLTSAVYIFIPAILSADIIGWIFRLRRLIKSLTEIERELEGINKPDVSSESVMRLVSEYNSQVITGIPIHSFLFNKYHAQIRSEWNERQGKNIIQSSEEIKD